jgi:hypothetical protein
MSHNARDRVQSLFSPHPRLADFRLRVNRRLMVWLAARRQGCAFGLHL